MRARTTVWALAGATVLYAAAGSGLVAGAARDAGQSAALVAADVAVAGVSLVLAR